MARTIAEIQAEIIDSIHGSPELSEANSTSVTALWRLFAYVVATVMATLENLWDVYRAAVIDTVEALKPHTLRWYAEKAFAYIQGADLEENSDDYPADLLFDESQKIIGFAAATEAGGILTLKVAKAVGNQPEPLTPTEYEGFRAYIAEIKDAGVQMQVLSAPADRVIIEADVYYDPLILDSAGARLDGSDSTPVRDAVTQFLLSLPFDGKFIKAKLTDVMQRVPGVLVPEIRVCRATRHDNLNFQNIDISYDSFSGFIKIYANADLTLNYIANV